jgi:hypothetical protein
VNADTPLFPEYGDGGDFIGARRMRRAFRWGVAACVLLTFMLWCSERFLRYDHAEQLYISALTLAPESGRNFLRQIAVEYDRRKENPPSKYLEALALREEDDLVLPMYRRAFELDPNNAALAIRYGCRLFRGGDAATARLRLREAAESNPRNVLPMYLEAAVLPWVNETSQDLGASFAIITRANTVGEHVAFPRPLWSSALPERGYWYAGLRRQSVEECTEPLYRFADELSARTSDAALGQDPVEWVSRLQAMAVMGKRIASGAVALENGETVLTGGAPQAYAGLYVMQRAIQLLKRVPAAAHKESDEELIKAGVQVDNAMKQITGFENGRNAAIDADRATYRMPIVLVRDASGVLLAAYLIVHVVCKLSRVQSANHTVPHGRAGLIAFGLWGAMVVVLPCLVASLHAATPAETAVRSILVGVWWGAVPVTLAFACVYPATVVPGPRKVLRTRTAPDASPSLERTARTWHRTAYLSLLRRFLGVQIGLLLAGACSWVIVFRLVTGLYPWQFEVLATGLTGEETNVVRSALALVT